MNTATIAPAVRQKIEIPYSYVAGPAVTKFLLGLKDKMFIASVCSACRRKSVPPLSFCGRCWQPITEFVEVGPEGRLESFAAVPRASVDLQGMTGPLVYGLIRLTGADTLLAHFLQGEGKAMRAGAPVEPVWREPRSGSILDVAGFRVRT